MLKKLFVSFLLPIFFLPGCKERPVRTAPPERKKAIPAPQQMRASNTITKTSRKNWFDKKSLRKLTRILPEKYLVYPGKKLASNPDIYWMRSANEKCYEVSFPGGYASGLLNSLDYVHLSDEFTFEVGLVFDGKPKNLAADLSRELKKKKLSLGAVGTFYSSGSAMSPPGMSYKYQSMVLKELPCPSGKSGLVKTEIGWRSYRESLKNALKGIVKNKALHRGKLNKNGKLADFMFWSTKAKNQLSLLKKFGFRKCKRDSSSDEKLKLLPGIPKWVYAMTFSHIDYEREVYVGGMGKNKILLSAYKCKRKD